jgi:hypothetical protein
LKSLVDRIACRDMVVNVTVNETSVASMPVIAGDSRRDTVRSDVQEVVPGFVRVPLGGGSRDSVPADRVALERSHCEPS